MTFTIDDFREMLRCAKRELAMRENCYPRWVRSGKMKQWESDQELAAMRNIVAHLESIMKTMDQKQSLPLAERDGA